MQKSNKILLAILVPTITAFIFIYPRVLIAMLGQDNPWTSYLYQYTFGAIFFGLGVLLMLRTKACVPGRGRDSLWLKMLIGGFVFFAGLHGLWVYMALSWPAKG